MREREREFLILDLPIQDFFIYIGVIGKLVFKTFSLKPGKCCIYIIIYIKLELLILIKE